MNELSDQPGVAKPWYRSELFLFIGGSLIMAFVLVLIGMALYESSGAAQLDLSRPGYNLVRSEVNQSNAFEGFPADGPVTRDVLDEFQELYEKQVKPVTGKDAFSSAVLDDSALNIDDAPIDK